MLPAAQVTIDESGKGQHQEKTGSDCVKFPALGKGIAYPRLEKEGNAADQEIENDQF